jgi:hypothetical protein
VAHPRNSLCLIASGDRMRAGLQTVGAWTFELICSRISRRIVPKSERTPPTHGVVFLRHRIRFSRAQTPGARSILEGKR